MTWRELAILLAKAIDEHIFFKVKKTVTQARPMQDFYEGVICYPLWHFPRHIANDVENHPNMLGCHDLRLGVVGSLEDCDTVGFRWPTSDSEDGLWREFVRCLCFGGHASLSLEKDIELIDCNIFYCESPEEAYLKACLADARVANAKLREEAVDE